MRTKLLVPLLAIGCLWALAAETAPSPTPDAFAQNRRLGRGMNILGYDPIWGPVAGADFREEHFRLIREAGFQSVRICLFPFRDGRCAHDGWLSDAWLDKVDWAVKQALSHGLAVIVDYHESGDLGARPLRYREALLHGWKQLGERFKDSPPSVFFEILNEPHGELTPSLWNRMFREVLAVIRQSNPARTVIIGPGGYNHVDYLEQLDLPEDDRNIIVTVHYYSPIEFTHQGLRCLGRAIPVGASWSGTEQQRQAIVRDFEKVQTWAQRNRRPILLGEFGAYRKADLASRACWTSCVRQEAEKRGWSWAYWHFNAGFPVYDIREKRWLEPIREALIPISPGLAEPPTQSDEMAARTKADPRVRQYIVPKRILWQSPDDQSVVEHSENLLKVGPGQVTLDGENVCTLRHKGKSPGVLLDFGRELHGGVQIMVAGTTSDPVRLRVCFGESASEAMSELGGPKNATNDHAIRDQTCLVPFWGTHEIGNTGFRFVRIELVDPHKYVALKGVRAVFLYRDLPYRGSFRCNDERLNRIWQTGAYTVHLNMQDYLWDGIKRDRLVWIGDMYPETMTIGAVFGNHEIVPASLDLTRNGTPLPRWMNGISSYSMWWILIQHSWYRHHGDLDYLRQQKPYLAGLLGQLIKHIGPDNRETLPEWRFLDWPSNGNNQAIHAGLQALVILTLDAGRELCGTLGDSAMQTKCRDAVARLRQHVPDCGSSKQAAALMVLAGLGDPVALNRKVLAVDGAKRMSTFYGYYVLQARAKAGDYQGCLDCIRNYWGTMLDLGATTFWEDFDLDWTVNASRIDELVPAGKKDIHGDFGNYCYKGFRHSLCHGWASGPTPWLSEHVLGIKIVEPGCKAVKIEPHLADLQWAEGTFPTPMGVIKVRHEKQPDGAVRSTVDAPPGIRVIGS